MKSKKTTLVAAVLTLLLALTLALPAAAFGQGKQGADRPGGQGLGLKLSPRDPDPARRFNAAERGIDSSLPLAAAIDVSDDLPPIGDQGAQSSCVGWSTGYYCKSWWEKQEHPGWNQTNAKYYFSPSYVYNQINGGYDGGASIYDAMQLLESIGCVDYADFPYSDADYTTQPTSDQVEAGSQYRIPNDWDYFFSEGSWGPYVRADVVTGLKTYLSTGKPVVLGIPIYADFPDYGYNPVSAFYDYDGASGLEGGHAIFIAGYDDSAGGGQGGFLMVNSWGPSWNSNGKVYLSYDFVQDYVAEGWCMSDRDSTPLISTISPNPVPAGDQLTIEGDNFGADRYSSKVEFQGGVGSVKSWTNDEIEVTVPVGATSGNMGVYDWNLEISNLKSVTVGPSILAANGWMLAEGCTNEGFDEWVLIQNPHDADSNVKLTFLTPGGQVAGPEMTVFKQSRMSVHVNELVPNSDVSTIVSVTNDVSVCAERSMYVNRADGKWGAHDSIAAEEPSDIWYLAEGATWPGYDEWVLVMNPYKDTVTAQLTFQTPQGEILGPTLGLEGGTRQSVHVNQFVPDSDVSTKVVCVTPDRGVVAERAMYINTPDGKRDCHNSTGLTETWYAWAVAEGATWPGYETWVLVQNPTNLPVTANFFFVTPTDVWDGPVLGIQPGARVSVKANDWCPQDDVSTIVLTNDESELVVVERALYTSDPVAVGATNAPGSCWVSTEWYLPEGCTNPGFSEYVLVMNPYQDQSATVHLEFMTDQGAVEGPGAALGPLSRVTFRVNDYVTGDVSTKVVSDTMVVAERAMYISAGGKGGATGSLGIRAGLVPGAPGDSGSGIVKDGKIRLPLKSLKK